MSVSTKDLVKAANALQADSTLRKQELALEAIDNATVALNNLTRYVASIDPASLNPCDVCKRKGVALDVAAKTVAYMSKMQNDAVRLVEFCKGNADSRMALTAGEGLGELLKLLSPEQFNMVLGWMEQAEANVQPTLN